jgi:hypothetical protein
MKKISLVLSIFLTSFGSWGAQKTESFNLVLAPQRDLPHEVHGLLNCLLLQEPVRVVEAYVGSDITVDGSEIPTSEKRALHKVVQKCIVPQRFAQDIIVWGIGEDGLTERCCKFYQDNLFRLLRANDRTTVWFYDLSAWKGLTSSAVSPIDTVTIPEALSKEVSHKNLSSRSFFCWLKQLPSNPACLQCVRKIVCRDAIFKKSEQWNTSDLTCGDVPYLARIMPDHRLGSLTSTCYSALQYLEALFLVCFLIERNMQLGKLASELCFLLPGDEYTYYQGDDGKRFSGRSFQQDLEKVIATDAGLKDRCFTCRIRFLSFQYNAQGCMRPYLVSKNGSDKIVNTPGRYSLVSMNGYAVKGRQ